MTPYPKTLRPRMVMAFHRTYAAPGQRRQAMTGQSSTATAALAWIGMAPAIRKGPEIHAARLAADTRHLSP